MKRFTKSCFRSATLLGLIAGVLWLGQSQNQVVVAREVYRPVENDTHTYVGPLASAAESARIGIVCDTKNFMVYVCSQDAAFNADHAAWFKGARTGDTIEAASGNRTLKASIVGDKVTGEIKSGGKTISFTAKNCDDHVVAGLYRAEDMDDNQKCVFGWVVDEDGFVAGGRQQANVKGTAVVPNNGVLNGVNAQVNQKAQPINGLRVQNPANPPVGVKGKKFTPERRQEFINRLVAKTPQGGNPLMAGLIHMVKRFNAGLKAEGEVEQAAFAQLRKAPRQALVDYEKNWEKIPVAVRERLVGTELKGLDIKQPLTKERARVLAQKSGAVPRSAPPKSPGAGAPIISQVTVKELKCLKTTSSVGEGRDEIFAVYAVGAGNQLFAKTTGAITKIKNGDSNNFVAADQIVFPPAEQPGLTSAEDVLIVAKLFESDGNIDLIKNMVKVLVDAGLVTVAIVTAPAGAGVAGFIAPANILIDQIAAGLDAAQPLGEDSFRATTEGRTRKVENDSAKNSLEFRRDDKQGPAPFRYELRNLDVKLKN